MSSPVYQPKVFPKAPSRKELQGAGVFIDQLEKEQWPSRIIELANYLTNDNFTGVLDTKQFNRLSARCKQKNYIPIDAQLEPGEPMSEDSVLALREARQSHNYILTSLGFEPGRWASVAKASIIEWYKNRLLEYIEDTIWPAHETWIPSLSSLPPPCPSVAFGLSISHNRKDGRSLRQAVLDTLKLDPRHNPVLNTQSPVVAYPSFILHADYTMEEAVNQTANSAAASLSKYQGLYTKYKEAIKDGELPESCPLPVLVVCIEDRIWQVMLAFQHQDQIHLVTIWKGDVSLRWHFFQFHFIFGRCETWLLKILSPEIQKMATAIHEQLMKSLAG